MPIYKEKKLCSSLEKIGKIEKNYNFYVSFIPYFHLLVFAILVTLVAWFSFLFFCLAHLAFQNVNKDYESDQKPKTKNGKNEIYDIWYITAKLKEIPLPLPLIGWAGLEFGIRLPFPRLIFGMFLNIFWTVLSLNIFWNSDVGGIFRSRDILGMDKPVKNISNWKKSKLVLTILNCKCYFLSNDFNTLEEVIYFSDRHSGQICQFIF